jgi:hypothetical protein
MEEKTYELRYGWNYVGSNYVYVEYKVFLSKKKRDKYLFNLFQSKTIEIKWYKKFDIADWKSWDC